MATLIATTTTARSAVCCPLLRELGELDLEASDIAGRLEGAAAGSRRQHRMAKPAADPGLVVLDWDFSAHPHLLVDPAGFVATLRQIAPQVPHHRDERRLRRRTKLCRPAATPSSRGLTRPIAWSLSVRTVRLFSGRGGGTPTFQRRRRRRRRALPPARTSAFRVHVFQGLSVLPGRCRGRSRASARVIVRLLP